MPVHRTESRSRTLEEVTLPSAAENHDELDEIIVFDKMKVECICPKCGERHIMNFHWIGRGVPRKYCPLCKGSV